MNTPHCTYERAISCIWMLAHMSTLSAMNINEIRRTHSMLIDRCVLCSYSVLPLLHSSCVVVAHMNTPPAMDMNEICRTISMLPLQKLLGGGVSTPCLTFVSCIPLSRPKRGIWISEWDMSHKFDVDWWMRSSFLLGTPIVAQQLRSSCTELWMRFGTHTNMEWLRLVGSIKL